MYRRSIGWSLVVAAGWAACHPYNSDALPPHHHAEDPEPAPEPTEHLDPGYMDSGSVTGNALAEDGAVFGDTAIAEVIKARRPEGA